MTITGKIIKSVGGFYHVEAPDGILICKARGLFRLKGISPCAGDTVNVIIENENEPVITEIKERKNELIRPPLANLDAVFIIVSTVEPKPNALILDKLIFIMESKEIEPVLVFTKTDKKLIDDFIGKYFEIGFLVFSVDNTTGAGTEKIKEFAVGKTTAFIGNSGVGKSSLLNHLLPGEQLVTAEISKKLGRGRHTTRLVELFKTDGGGYIADTPGFSTIEESRYGNIPAAQTAYYFREMQAFLGKCKYTGCTHTKEEGCAIIEAAKVGKIEESRYNSYIKIYSDAVLSENNYR